jgi:hypothetical protein
MRVRERVRTIPLRKRSETRGRRAGRALSSVAALAMVVFPFASWADGIFEGITGSVESTYAFVSTKTTDGSGNSTATKSNNYFNRFTLNVNYNLYPKLNLNAGGTFEDNLTDPVDTDTLRRTEFTRFRPYVFLTLRDPVYTGSLGYDLREDMVRVSGLPKTTLTQDNYIASFDWRPEALPWTNVAYTRTNTHDGDRSVVDTEKDYLYLKSQYRYQGLDLWYVGTYTNTQDKVRNFETTEWSNEGRLAYSTTLFSGRTSLSTDNRVNVTTFDTRTGGQGQVGFPVFPLAGLSVLSDTPTNVVLSPTPALIDGNLTVSAGINIGLPGLGGDTRQRNVGLDFLAPQELNSIQVWVDRDLPFEITNAFVWEVYTSTDNLNWTLHQAAAPAPFGPFLTRFEISFPKVTTRYIKVVTRPLSAAVIIPPGFANPDQIFITELQAFINTPAQDIRQSTTRTFQNYTLDVKTRLLNTPTLYYDFNAYYLDLSPDGQRRYNISNGLFVNHAFNPILSTSANASIEVGEEQDQSRVALLYYASLVATPFRTLSHNLVFSGNNQTVGDLTNRSNAVALYNTAQLYKGVDATLNLGVALTSEEQIGGGWVDRRRLYVNPGINVSPHPSLVLTVYYLGQQLHTSGAPATPADATENRVDLGASWTPFRSLFLSATVNIVTETWQEARIQQNYGLNWTPFPDGQLQFSFFYSDSYYPDRSTVVQPTLRWYLSPRRRSYLDLSYQRNRSESAGQKTDTDIVSTSLKIYF